MAQWDILIAGAGAAGLMCGTALAKAGKKVILLEAQNRSGGRIHTLDDPHFITPAETGAEFIHGHLPITFSLLKEAGIAYHPAMGDMIRIHNGQQQSFNFYDNNWEIFEKQLAALQEDMSLDDFLQNYFSGDEYAGLRNMAANYASGYDAADTSKVSVFSLREEWLHEEESGQYSIAGGYGTLIRFMEKKFLRAGGEIQFSKRVKHIEWQKNQVTIRTTNGKSFDAGKVIITVPLGILQLPSNHEYALNFSPAIHQYLANFASMGFGTVIKILLQFNADFLAAIWPSFAGDNNHPKFIISNEIIPTWWTQSSMPCPLLTGWTGGKNAQYLASKGDDFILEKAIISLAHILSAEPAELKKQVTACRVANWAADPFTFGAYSYPVVNGEKAIRAVRQPLEHTIYFCGEALYSGKAIGTVEAALASAKYTVDLIL